MSSFDMDEKSKTPSDTENYVQPIDSKIIGHSDELSKSSTQRGLKSRHAQMIALGGTIGTGLFVGSGQGLHMGGPVFLFFAYAFITFLVFGIIIATTEMSSYLPVPGSSMALYANRYVSRSLGFALGWMYWYVFAITVPAEVTATSIVIQYWHPPVNIAVWITITILVVVALNCFPVKVYGEAEFWFASIKVFGIIGLLIVATVLVFGGGPNHELLGFHYWKHPGPVKEYLVTGDSGRLCALISTTVFSVFAFAFAPELLVVTGGEMQSPRRNLPIARRRYFYRLVVFYVLGVFAIGLIISSDNPSLLVGGSGAGFSPWAVAIREAGIKGLDSVVNAVIITSSCGNAPRIFLRCTKSGIPYYATAASASLSLLAYLNCASTGATVFNWFVNLINTGGFQSWICICIVYLRFRKAMIVQQIVDLPYRSRFQPYMAWISGFMFTVLLLLNGFKVFLSGYWNTSDFLTAYIGIPIFVCLYFGHKFLKARDDPWLLPLMEIDLTTGLDEIIAAETSGKNHYKWYMKWRAIFE